MRVDSTRLARGLALATWAAFFDWLWLSGHASAYVGPRTTWVVGFGAVTLTVVAVGLLAGVRVRERRPGPSIAELAGLLLLVAPVLLALTTPTPSLGALAVEKKRTDASTLASNGRLGDGDGTVRLYELASAAASPEWARRRGLVPGLEVNFVGLVSKPEGGGRIELARFLATCCAADALPYTLSIDVPDGTPRHEEDTWVRVRGTLDRAADGGLVVTAGTIEETEAPANPYG